MQMKKRVEQLDQVYLPDSKRRGVYLLELSDAWTPPPRCSVRGCGESEEEVTDSGPSLHSSPLPGDRRRC